MRTALYFAATALVLVICNWMIFAKQRVVDHGATILLALAPVDPRSLMQGDYMALRYEAAGAVPDSASRQGRIVVRRDERNVAAFVRVDDGAPLAPNEALLKYRRGSQVRLGAESFFFEEGTAVEFDRAKFGELRVAPDGSSVLVGLRDAGLHRLGLTDAAK